MLILLQSVVNSPQKLYLTVRRWGLYKVHYSHLKPFFNDIGIYIQKGDKLKVENRNYAVMI